MKNLHRSLPVLRTLLLALVVAIIADCAKKKEPEVWYCPMHTHYRTDHAGNCPICGMALVKEEAPTKVTDTHSPEQHKEKEEAKAAPAATITVTPEQQKLVGITTAKPKERKLSLSLQLAGQVAYEPDIYAAIIEYRQLAAAAHTLEGSVGGSANLTQSAVLRLRQLGVSSDEIQQYARSETAASRLITGHGGGKALITLRLSEADLSFMRKGMAVKITAPAYPGKTWNGQVTAIGSLVDAKNRSLSARVLVSDSGQLTSQMAVTAEIAIRAGNGVSIERSAVLDTGARQVVFVKVSATEFEPRAVRVLGGNEEYALVSGITAKDDVAVSSAFLLDSEAKLRLGDSVTGSHQGH
ncbi:MAG: efflux RND transporter periplasmic adaptor subunit [Spirochaetota bacterium]